MKIQGFTNLSMLLGSTLLACAALTLSGCADDSGNNSSGSSSGSSGSSSGAASDSMVVQRIALCLGVPTIEVKGVSTEDLEILDIVGEVALTQLTCGGEMQLNVKQLRYLYLIILRLLRGNRSPALETIVQQFRDANRDPRAIAEAIASVVARVARLADLRAAGTVLTLTA